MRPDYSISANTRPLVADTLLAVLDQALFAGTNLLFSVLLARWLPTDDFGGFAVMYAVLLLASELYCACVVEPASVLAAVKTSLAYRVHVRAAYSLHWLVVGAISALLVVLAVGQRLCAVSDWVWQGELAAALALPGTALLFFVRRAAHVRRHSDAAVKASVVYLLILCGAMLALKQFGMVTVTGAFAALGLAGGGAALSQSRAALVPVTRVSFRAAIWAWQTQWPYVRWGIPAVPLMWLPSNMYYGVLGVSHGLQHTAALRAYFNLVNPSVHALTAVALFMSPEIARALHRGGASVLLTKRKAFMRIGFGGAAAYGVFLVTTGPRLADWVYGGRYSDLDALHLFLLAAVPLVATFLAVGSSTVRGLAKPKHILSGYLCGALIALFVGVPATYVAGVSGALAGILASYLATAIWLQIASNMIIGGAARSHTLSANVGALAAEDPAS